MSILRKPILRKPNLRSSGFLRSPLLRSERGASLTEYAITLGAVSLLAIGLLTHYSGKVQELFGAEVDTIQVASTDLGAKGGNGLGGSGGGTGGGAGGSGEGSGGGGQTQSLLDDPSITLTVDETNAWELDGYFNAGAEGSATIAYEVTGTEDFLVSPWLTGDCTALTNETLPWAPTAASGEQEIIDDGSLSGCSYHFEVSADEGMYYEAVTIDFGEVIIPDWTIDVTLNGDKSFVVAGPGDSVDLAWAMTVVDDELYGHREFRNINGICPEEGGTYTTVPILTVDDGMTGAEEIEWNEDWAGCFAEFTFGVTDLNDMYEQFLDNKTVIIAFTDFDATTPADQSMTVNGEEELNIGVGETAHFEWNSTMAMPQQGAVYKTSSCSSIPVGSTIPQSGSLDQAWNSTIAGCNITMCLEGAADPESESVESCATAHFIVSDTTPDAMVFPTMFDAATSTLVSSNAVTVSGINTATTLTISSGGSVSKNGGTAVTGSVTVNNGDSIVIKTTTSSSASADANITLTKTGFSASWRVLNTSADQTPTMGNFTSITGQPVATQVFSNIVVPSAYAAMPISVTNGTAVINNGGSTGKLPGTTSGVMNSGNGIFLTTTTPSAASTSKTVTVNYGPGLSLSKTWSVTTRASESDQMPGQWTFNTDYETSTATTLKTVPIKPAGFDTPFWLEVDDAETGPVTVCVNMSCLEGGNTVSPGDEVTLEMVADDVCDDIDFHLKVSSGGSVFAGDSWTACPWFGPDEENITCQADTVQVGILNPKSFSLPDGYLGEVYPKLWVHDGPGFEYGAQEYYFSCGAVEWAFDRSGAGCGVGLGANIDPEHADGELFSKNKGRCANWMQQVHRAAVTCSVAQATNMSACVTANSPSAPPMCRRSFDGEHILCDENAPDGWEGDGWVSSIKG